MVQNHAINGTAINYVAQVDWEDVPVDEALNGITVHHRWRRHYWRTEALPASEFDTLYELEGQKVNIATVDYYDRTGDYKTYYGAELRSIEAEHTGPIFQSLNIEFWVRV